MSRAAIGTDTQARLRLAIGRLHRRLRAAERGGLTPSQVSTLASIEAFGPLRLGELAARESLAPPTLSRILAVLEAEGYVDRAADPADGRSSLVSLSARGRAAVSEIRAERGAELERRLARLDPDQLARLVAAVPVLEALADD